MPQDNQLSVPVAENDYMYIENEAPDTVIDENMTEPAEDLPAEPVETEVTDEEATVDQEIEKITVEEENPSEEFTSEEEVASEEENPSEEEVTGEEENLNPEEYPAPAEEKYSTEEEPPKEEGHTAEEEYPVEEEWVEEPDSTGKPETDFAGFTRKEIIARFRTLLEEGDIDTIREEVDNMKYQFYRKLKAEEELKRAVYIENGGADESYTYEEDELELILKSLMLKYRDFRIIQNEKLETEKQKNLEEKLRIIDEIKELTSSSESIGETFQQFRELQNRWRTIGLVPQNKVKNLWDTYHHYVEVFYDYIKINKDLRDLDFKRNLEEKIKLCEKAESLLLESSIVNAFHTLQACHDQWREIGPVPQEMRVEIWERFKAISAQVNKKHQEYFENLKETYKNNKEAKEALCAKVEEITGQSMDSSNHWRKNAQEIIEIQKLWNTIGHATKKDDLKLFKRFHTLCDRFFSQKREFTGHERKEQENNLQLKQDLCVQAEALKDSTEWKATTEEFIQLQHKWKEIGSVPPKQREYIWKRFRKACDYFFEQKTKHHSSVESEYDNNLKAKRELIEQIKNFVQTKNPEECFEQLKEYQRQWSAIGFVPHKYKNKIQDEYRNAISKQFDAIRLDDSERERLHFKSRVESMVSAPQSRVKLNSERNKLMSRHQQLQSDLVLWENNIGFFSKSKKSENMVANVQRMIEDGKAEMKELKEKIRYIDSLENNA